MVVFLCFCEGSTYLNLETLWDPLHVEEIESTLTGTADESGTLKKCLCFGLVIVVIVTILYFSSTGYNPPDDGEGGGSPSTHIPYESNFGDIGVQQTPAGTTTVQHLMGLPQSTPEGSSFIIQLLGNLSTFF